MERVVGVIIALLMGFVLFLTLTGLGFLLGLVLKAVPVWYTVLGTFVCTLGLLLYLSQRSDSNG